MMSAVPAPKPNYREWIIGLPPEGRLYQEGVPWETYARLVEELIGIKNIRVSYDRGRMEIMSISSEHEGYSGLFTHLIQVLTEELGLDFTSRGSMTMVSKLKELGLEADDCFYIEDLQRILGKKRVDMDQDAPPDLAIEVDITNPTLNKLPIYAGLGVGEVWRYSKGRLEFYQLEQDTYTPISHSKLFSFLPPDILAVALEQGVQEGINAMRRTFREWVQTHRQ